MRVGSIYLVVVFSIIGAGYMYSGKRKGNARLFVCGLILGLFPYFTDKAWLLLLVGGVVAAYPLVFRKN